jgi:hypothetical protein
MLLVPTPPVASPAPVTGDMLEVEPHAQVSCSFCVLKCIIYYVPGFEKGAHGTEYKIEADNERSTIELEPSQFWLWSYC